MKAIHSGQINYIFKSQYEGAIYELGVISQMIVSAKKISELKTAIANRPAIHFDYKFKYDSFYLMQKGYRSVVLMCENFI